MHQFNKTRYLSGERLTGWMASCSCPVPMFFHFEKMTIPIEQFHISRLPVGRVAARLRGPRWAAGAVCLLALGSSTAAMAQGLSINAGETVNWGAPLNLDCGDLVVNGTLNAPGVAFSKVGKVIIGVGGQLNAANTTIEVTTSWQNSGAFNAAASTVTASNACSNAGTTFSGNTAFTNLSASTAGHTLSFATGSEQTVSGALTLNGVTLLGQGGTAFLSLLAGGTQNIANVGVNGVDASHGQHLAPTAVNAITGTANNWFTGSTPTTPTTPAAPTPVPATEPAGLALLAGLIGAAMCWSRRRPGKARGH